MARLVLSLVSGLLFGIGFAVSDMVDPARVRGFLDIFGAWDPTLAFVMGGAVATMIPVWLIQRRMSRPLTQQFELPGTKDITPTLVAGSALFGIGWGIAGLCPGPGLAAFAFAPLQAALFVAGLLAGMAVHHFATKTGRAPAHANA